MPDNKSPTFHRNEPPVAKAPHPSPPAPHTGAAWTYSVYGAAGELLGTFKGCSVGGVQFLCEGRLRVYFGGRLILNGWTGVRPDRLGSPDGTHGRVYPYGEVSGSVSPDQDETYTTYTRDAYTGLDYAKNRSYAYAWGRFLIADPYRASGGPANPGSWNRYAYVQNDPMSLVDPAGLQAARPQVSTDPITVFADWDPWGVQYYSTDQWWDGGVGGGGGGPTHFAPPGTGSGGGGAGDSANKQNANKTQSERDPVRTSRCAGNVEGVGFGWTVGVSGALGVGPNGPYGVAGTATAAGGTFLGEGNRTDGVAASAGFAGTNTGSQFNYPRNDSREKNATIGGFAGIGGGVFLTNAGNSTTLQGAFTTYLLSVGIFGIQYDHSGSIWVASITVGKSTGFGITRLQTNTFATACR